MKEQTAYWNLLSNEIENDGVTKFQPRIDSSKHMLKCTFVYLFCNLEITIEEMTKNYNHNTS